MQYLCYTKTSTLSKDFPDLVVTKALDLEATDEKPASGKGSTAIDDPQKGTGMKTLGVGKSVSWREWTMTAYEMAEIIYCVQSPCPRRSRAKAVQL